jgi:iron complex outermembrane receptor protein
MRRLPILAVLAALAVLIALAGPAGAADRPDERPVLTLEPITVTGQRLSFGSSTVVPGRHDLNRALEQLGLLTVRRGVPLASDLHADGFKRGDLGVVVDGERYHCACPNRMDPPTSLALPIEIASATWECASAAPTAGLAGQLSLRRSVPGEPWRVRAGLAGTAASGEDLNASLALERRGQRLSGRWARGESYRDARGASFGDRYGYRAEDVRYSQGDLAWRMSRGRLSLGAQASRTRDVPYAYLLMDERENDLWNASIGIGGARAYVNRARHLMNNGLRASTMTMSTLADQVTAGVSGRAWGTEVEGYWRHWNASNVIATPMASRHNHLIPLYRQWSANAARGWTAGAWQASLRAGATRAVIADHLALRDYRALEPGAEAERWFAPFSASIGWRAADAGLAAIAEVASEAPGAEQLFIVVRRPMMPVRRPDWIGNPELDAPVRATLRGVAWLGAVEAEAHASRVADYVEPVRAAIGMTPVTTYAGVEAALAGVRLAARGRHLEWRAAYTAGWNLSGDRPLAEMAPLTASVTGRMPLGRGLEGLARIEGAGRQSRVDPALAETGTPGWARLDLGIGWRGPRGAHVELEVENVTDAYFAQHLSYVRDPFASGARVTEPGRTVRITLTSGR